MSTSFKDIYPNTYLLLSKLRDCGPKTRSKLISQAQNENDSEWALLKKNGFSDPSVIFKAFISDISKWPQCVCGKPVKLHTTFAKACSKKCASTGKSRVHAGTIEKITKSVEQLQDIGIKCSLMPKSVVEKVNWTHEDHTFIRSIYSGGIWLKGCPVCNKKHNGSQRATNRWKAWNEKNPKTKWTHSEKSKHQIKKTVRKKYGVDNVGQCKDIRKKINETYRKNYINITATDLVNKIEKNLNVIPYDNHIYDDSSKKHKWIHRDCGHVFEHCLNYHSAPPECPNCRPISKPEEELKRFVMNHVKIEPHRRDLLGTRHEIDIYVPSQHLGIEMNGVFWHSTHQNSTPILKKTQLASDKGINLIHIWETEWKLKQDIVKSIILSKLNLSKQKIYARKCEIVSVDNQSAKEFFAKNHIHGGQIRVSECVGLKYNNEIVMVIAIGKPRFSKTYDLEIIRSCSKLYTQVVGGFQKLLKELSIRHTGKTLVSYADLRFYTGKSYEAAGFQFVRNSAPNYSYVKNSKTLSRYDAQKKKLPKILGEKFSPELTESENMIMAGWLKIEDCGNGVWSKTL